MQERFAVIALGGNAILQKGQDADPATQMANIREAVDNLSTALDRYSAFALTHGNGPQVGNDLIRSYRAYEAEELPELGLADCVANTQGRIGHWFVKEMKDHPRFRSFRVACVLTHVYVDRDSFAPEEYTKYVGPWRPNDPETRAALDRRGIVYRVPDGQTQELRRVVPSPDPYEIEEFGAIARWLQNGVITICCGGGGIPVFDTRRDGPESGERFRQSEVVIDKDRVSALLAAGLLETFEGADIELVILMDRNGLYRDARCREEDFIPKMTLDELNGFLSSTDLDPGTIRPKLEAIQHFLEAGGRNAYLGPLSAFDKVFDASEPVGTQFTSAPQLSLYS